MRARNLFSAWMWSAPAERYRQRRMQDYRDAIADILRQIREGLGGRAELLHLLARCRRAYAAHASGRSAVAFDELHHFWVMTARY